MEGSGGLLKREGMHPITEGFEEAVALYRESERGEEEKPLGGCDIEEYRSALGCMGVDGTGKLGRALGLRRRRASTLWNHPEELSAKQRDALTGRLAEIEEERSYEYTDMLHLNEETGGAYSDEVRSSGRDYEEVRAAIQTIARHPKMERALPSLRREFELRMLCECYESLGYEDRKALWKIIDGLRLSRGLREPKRPENSGRCAEVLECLAHLISSDSDEAEWLLADDESALEEHGVDLGLFRDSVIDEYIRGRAE